jgi:hypothetical protein
MTGTRYAVQQWRCLGIYVIAFSTFFYCPVLRRSDLEIRKLDFCGILGQIAAEGAWARRGGGERVVSYLYFEGRATSVECGSAVAVVARGAWIDG